MAENPKIVFFAGVARVKACASEHVKSGNPLAPAKPEKEQVDASYQRLPGL